MNILKTAAESLKGVKISTWVRLILLAAALVNGALRIFGIETFEIGNDFAEDIATVTVMVITSAAAFWKNNSFTEAAQAADEFLMMLRNSK